MSNSSRKAFLDFGLRLLLLLAFLPNAPPAPPRCGGRPPPGRDAPGAPPGALGPEFLYGPLLVGAPVDEPERGGKF